MIRMRNREITRMSGAGKRRSGFCNGALFSVLAAGAAVLAGITGAGYVTVLAADNVEQSQVMTGDDSLRLTGGVLPGMRMMQIFRMSKQMIPDRSMILKITRRPVQ